MPFAVEYDKSVRRLFPVSLALFGMLVLPLFLPSRSSAQINGTPPSVTSPGFGGRAVNGTPPSVTSLGRSGFAPSHAGGNLHGQNSSGSVHHRHHRVNGNAYYPYVYSLPVPYSMDVTDPDADASDDDAEYQGGPTIFDRRGSGRDSYVPPTYPGPAHSHSAPAETAQSDPAPDAAADPPEAPQPSTILIFKDGHQVEVGNYAIVSQTLYDLTPGHPRKIALADLDVPATQKQNDDRGISFQLPPSSQAN